MISKKDTIKNIEPDSIKEIFILLTKVVIVYIKFSKIYIKKSNIK